MAQVLHGSATTRRSPLRIVGSSTIPWLPKATEYFPPLVAEWESD